MQDAKSETSEKFNFEYTAYEVGRSVRRPSPGDNKRQCAVEIRRLEGRAVVIVSEDDQSLSRRAKKLNFSDIAFQLTHQGHFKNPWIYGHHITWLKQDRDWRGREVLRRVYITRSVHRIPTSRVYFWGKTVVR